MNKKIKWERLKYPKSISIFLIGELKILVPSNFSLESHRGVNGNMP